MAGDLASPVNRHHGNEKAPGAIRTTLPSLGEYYFLDDTHMALVQFLGGSVERRVGDTSGVNNKTAGLVYFLIRH